jgi:hypothetical protein
MSKIERKELEECMKAYICGMRDFCESKEVSPVTYLSFILGEYIYIFNHLEGTKAMAIETLDKSWDIALN